MSTAQVEAPVVDAEIEFRQGADKRLQVGHGRPDGRRIGQDAQRLLDDLDAAIQQRQLEQGLQAGDAADVAQLLLAQHGGGGRDVAQALLTLERGDNQFADLGGFAGGRRGLGGARAAAGDGQGGGDRESGRSANELTLHFVSPLAIRSSAVDRFLLSAYCAGRCSRQEFLFRVSNSSFRCCGEAKPVR